MRLVNTTPHDINIVDDAGNVVMTYPRSSMVVRVSVTTKPVGSIDGVELVATEFGEVTGLPDPCEGTMYIVSRMVVDNSTRDDLVGPDVGPGQVVRDENGQIVGVRRFTR